MPRARRATYVPAMTNDLGARDPGAMPPTPSDEYDRQVQEAIDDYRAFTRAALARAIAAEEAGAAA